MLASALASYRTAGRVGRRASWPLRRQACWPPHELATALVAYCTAERAAKNTAVLVGRRSSATKAAVVCLDYPV